MKVKKRIRKSSIIGLCFVMALMFSGSIEIIKGNSKFEGKEDYWNQYCKQIFSSKEEAQDCIEYQQYLTQKGNSLGEIGKEIDAKINALKGDIPVSYTHLDVYKRQALENLIYQYKEQRDIALAEVFLYRFAHKINQRYAGYSIVFMPSSLQKVQERGFSHLKEMTKMLTLPYYDGVKKTSTQKQSLQNKEGRKTIGKYLELDDTIPIPDTPLLLFDDVCTSGATLSAVKALLASHPHPVDACVLSVHPLFVEYCDENSLYESEGCFILKKQKEVGK